MTRSVSIIDSRHHAVDDGELPSPRHVSAPAKIVEQFSKRTRREAGDVFDWPSSVGGCRPVQAEEVAASSTRCATARNLPVRSWLERA